MAQKYGGQYSPNGEQASNTLSSSQGAKAPAKVSRLKSLNVSMRIARRRLKTYRIMGIVLGVSGLINLLTGSPISGLITIACAFGVMLASEITKAGLEAEAVYNEKTIARAPAYPRKIIGAGMMGICFLIAARFSVGADWITSIGIGLAGLIGMIMAYGLDPMRAKGLSGENRYEAGRAAEAIEKAQNYLDEIRELSKGMPDRKSRLEVESLALSAEDMFRALEEDPSDLRNSKRYLGVYLQGARDATAQFLQLPKSEQTADAEAKYLALIRELDEGFRQKRETILQDNRNSLDIEIDVLRERLASEGIKVKA